MVDINPLPPEQTPAPVPPPYQPPMPQANPYDFITNAGTVPTGPPKKKRIMIVAALFLVLLLVGVLVMALLSSGGGGPKDAYTTVLKDQAQLLHVSEKGEKTAHGSVARNLAITARLSISNTQSSVMALAKKAGATTEASVISAGLDKTIDEDLAQAELNNRFDEEFTEVMQELLTTYQKDLLSLRDQTENSNDKKVLEQAYNSAQQLIADNKKTEDQKLDSTN